MLLDVVNKVLHTTYSILVDVMLDAFRVRFGYLLFDAENSKELDNRHMPLLNRFRQAFSTVGQRDPSVTFIHNESLCV